MELEGSALKERIDGLQRTFTPPPELTGSRPRDVALTAGGRALYVAATVLFALAIVAGVLLNNERRSQAIDRQAFETHGVATTAEVTRLWLQSGTPPSHRGAGDSKAPWVAYRYVVDGAAYEGQAKTNSAHWKLLHDGMSLGISYLPEDPTRSRLAGVEPQSMPAWVPIIVGVSITAAPILMLVMLNRQRRLLMEGRPAPALVTKFAKHHSSHGGSHRSIRYAFPLLSGSMATGRSETSRNGPAVGSVICIVYDPDRPRSSHPYPFALVRPTKLAK